jgi:hypothetical protein
LKRDTKIKRRSREKRLISGVLKELLIKIQNIKKREEGEKDGDLKINKRHRR